MISIQISPSPGRPESAIHRRVGQSTDRAARSEPVLNISRGSLSEAAQEAYDRLLEQRRSGEPPEPVSLADIEAAGRAVVRDAKRALAEGRRVFLCRVPAMYDQPVAVGTAGLSGPSSVIESLENLGWRLDQMSWVPRAGFRAEGYFLFPPRCAARITRVSEQVGRPASG
ncbi:MAG: hypothetical protein ABSA53_30305 [Streptosporangiaceae bacterium]